MHKRFIATAVTAAALVAPATPALGAADTGANSNPSCIGLFSSSADIRGGLPRSYYAQLAAHSGANPGSLLHEGVGGPGDHC